MKNNAKNQPEISVIIPSLDGSRGGNVKHLKQQLAEQSLPPLEIIVVKGVSPNGKARNEGARQAHGDYYVFIDDDVTIGHQRMLENLIQPFLERDDVGMTGPSQLIPEDSNSLQRSAARQIPRSIFPVQTELVDSDMVSHMCLCMPAKLFRELGWENPEIISGTDPDLRHRVRQAGLRVCVVPDTWAYHPMPDTFAKLMRLSWNKGRNSAIVRYTHPDLILELDSGEKADFAARKALHLRTARAGWRMLIQLFSGKWIGLAANFAYYLGNLSETLSRHNHFWWIIIAITAIIGACGILYGSSHGAGISPDSVTYIDAARNSLAGKGLTLSLLAGKPMTHYPPLYPILLAATARITGTDPLHASSGINAAIFAVNIIIIGIFCRKIFRGMIIPYCGTLLAVFSPVFILPHLMAWSEPLFLLCGFATLLIIAGNENRKPGLILVAGIICAAAIMTRYAGIAFAAGAAACMLLEKKNRFSDRIRRTMLFLAAAGLPLMLWIVRNRQLGNSAVNRQISFHPPGITHLRQALRSILHLILPDSTLENMKNIPANHPIFIAAMIIITAGIVLIILFGIRQRHLLRNIPQNHIIQTKAVMPLLCFGVSYLILLLTAITFLDNTTPLSYRILAPILIIPLMILPAIAILVYKMKSYTFFTALSCISVVCILIANAFNSGILLRNSHIEGRGYSSHEWQNSKLIQTVKQIPAEINVYSNAPGAILMLAERVSKSIPSPTTHGKKQPDFQAKLNEMKNSIENGNACLIWFDKIPHTAGLQHDELRKLIPINASIETPDGTFYMAHW